MSNEIGLYQIVMIISMIFVGGVTTGQLIFQIKQSSKTAAEMEQVRHEIGETRRENGVIIGCLYALAAAIGNPQIKEVIEGMLQRERRL